MLYEKLDVFRKAYDLSLAIHKRSLDFPGFEQRELASQLRRSSKSICANLGEGMGKQASAKDVIRFIRMAIGSCDETRIWLKYSVDLGYISAEEYQGFYEAYCEVGRMLTGVVKRWSAKSSL
jgi:four helix bundle protein